MINSFIFSLNFRAVGIPRVGSKGYRSGSEIQDLGKVATACPSEKNPKCQGNNTPPTCGPSMTCGGWTNSKHLLDIIIPLLCAHYFQM